MNQISSGLWLLWHLWNVSSLNCLPGMEPLRLVLERLTVCDWRLNEQWDTEEITVSLSLCLTHTAEQMGVHLSRVAFTYRRTAEPEREPMGPVSGPLFPSPLTLPRQLYINISSSFQYSPISLSFIGIMYVENICLGPGPLVHGPP